MIRESDLPVKQVVDIADIIRVVTATGESVNVALTDLSKTIFDNYEGIEIDGRYESIGQAIGDLKRSVASTQGDVTSLQERATEIEDSVGDLQTTVVNMDSTVETLETDVEALKEDYIVEKGTKNGWRYRKWKSGKAEAWYDYIGGEATYDVWAAPIRYRDIEINIPSGIFTAAPSVLMTSANNQIWVVSAVAVSSARVLARLATVSTTAVQTIYALYCVQG